MNKILYITKHNPWGIGGGNVASKIYLYAFLQVFKDYQIDLCINGDIPVSLIPNEIKNENNIKIFRVKKRNIFSKILSPITKITHRYQDVAIELMRKNTYSYCIFDHSSIAGSLVNLFKGKTYTIVIHHNYEKDYFRDNTLNPLKRKLLSPVVEQNEQSAYINCDLNIFLTEEDLYQFFKSYGKNNKNNIVTGLFELNENYTKCSRNLKLPIPTIVITGSLCNVQNIDGITYFIKELYPLIPSNYKIIIAGKSPDEKIINMIATKSNIELIANPKDMKVILKRGNIFLSPARLGGGIKVRITDGLKEGLPIIAHKTSARGYNQYVEKGYFKSFDTTKDFELKLSQLISEIYNDKYNAEDISKMYSQLSSFNNKVLYLKEAIQLNNNNI